MQLWIKALISFVLFSLSLGVCAEGLDEKIQSIYKKTGFTDELPYEYFASGVKKFYKLRETGKIGSNPIVVYINFNLPSDRVRFFIVNIVTGDVALKTLVSHGINSGERMTESLSNEEGSKKSSEGFFISLNRYQSTKSFGRGFRIKGISSGLNDNVLDRGVVVHTGNYVNFDVAQENGRIGRSHGCFVVPREHLDYVFKILDSKTLMYAFKGEAEQVALQPQTEKEAKENEDPGDVPRAEIVEVESIENEKRFSSAKPSLGSQKGSAGNMITLLGALAAPVALMGISGNGDESQESVALPEDGPSEPVVQSTGVAPYSGSEGFERCQMYADRDWKEVATKIQAGEEPSQFFRGSWRDLDQKTKTSDHIEDARLVAMGQNHMGEIKECIALAKMTDIRNLEMNNPNHEQTVTSKDGKIVCQYKGAESMDYQDCLALVKTHDDLLAQQESMEQEQQDKFKQDGQAIVNAAGAGDVQAGAIAGANELKSNMQEVTAERQAFQTARIETLAAQTAAIPTYSSLHERCRRSMQSAGNEVSADYNAFIKPYSGVSVPLPEMVGDPCTGALNRIGIVPVQNRKAREGAKQVLQEIGADVDELERKYGTLVKQVNSTSILQDRGDRGFSSFSGLNIGQSNGGNKPGDAGGLMFTGGRGTLPGSNTKSSNDFSFSALSQQKKTASILESKDFDPGSLSASTRALWEIGQKQGPDAFYNSFKRILAQGTPEQVAELVKLFPNLAAEVAYEFSKGTISAARYKFLTENVAILRQQKSGGNRAPAGLGEIWADREGVTIFDIISRRYQQSFIP
jgi:hypothetical protein